MNWLQPSLAFLRPQHPLPANCFTKLSRTPTRKTRLWKSCMRPWVRTKLMTPFLINLKWLPVWSATNWTWRRTICFTRKDASWKPHVLTLLFPSLKSSKLQPSVNCLTDSWSQKEHSLRSICMQLTETHRSTTVLTNLTLCGTQRKVISTWLLGLNSDMLCLGAPLWLGVGSAMAETLPSPSSNSWPAPTSQPCPTLTLSTQILASKAICLVLLQQAQSQSIALLSCLSKFDDCFTAIYN